MACIQRTWSKCFLCPQKLYQQCLKSYQSGDNLHLAFPRGRFETRSNFGCTAKKGHERRQLSTDCHAGDYGTLRTSACHTRVDNIEVEVC